VQAQIHEAGGDVFQQGPAAGRVGHHQRHAMPTQPGDEIRAGETRMAYFDGMAQAMVARDVVPAMRQPAFVPAGERFRLQRIAWQGGEEILHHDGVVTERRRQLPQHGAEFLAQRQHTGGEEVGQRRGHIAQTLDVGDEARRLHREDEATRRVLIPALVALRPLQRIERTVELDAVEVPRGVVQLQPLRQVGRIETSAPGRVAPAGNADTCGHRRQPMALA